uniref:Spermatogenesis associated 46 n=1 Tax=Rousettus aegyptiacus TaxID=9407 RepID=A0A7J8BHC9_ROUAE|nr:spermatogenesis associated 46 [Rousettus aegyptiacus]
MERFSLLSISGPRMSSSAPSAFPDIVSSRATSLPDIAKGGLPTAASSPAQARPPSSALRHRLQPRRSCTVYRPWFSPYSYFVCADVDSRLEAHGFPEAPWAGGRGDGGLPEDAAESICSSSSPEDTCPREAAPEPRPGPDAADRITPQDVLMASRWQPAQQSGYKCVACCRMYPSLRSLQSHIRGGFKEGFSCRVYYRRLKALWGREQWARPGDRLSSSASCQASP